MRRQKPKNWNKQCYCGKHRPACNIDAKHITWMSRIFATNGTHSMPYGCCCCCLSHSVRVCVCLCTKLLFGKCTTILKLIQSNVCQCVSDKTLRYGFALDTRIETETISLAHTNTHTLTALSLKEALAATQRHPHVHNVHVSVTGALERHTNRQRTCDIRNHAQSNFAYK